MRLYRPVAALCFIIMVASEPAQACMIDAELDLNDIKYANVVVIGSIANYKVVLDPKARQSHREMTTETPELRDLPQPSGFLSDFARFDIKVEEVLVGKVPQIITVTWDNSTFGEPEDMPPGRYLIALRGAASDLPPLRGPSATILANPEPQFLTVLQAPCSSAFILPMESDDASKARKILATRVK